MSEFKSLAELVLALRDYQTKGILDSRFVKNGTQITLKATGNSEVVSADGGFLVGGEVIAPLLHSLSQKSSLFSKASKFYSSGPNVNKGFLPFVDESAGRTNSAFQLKTYWVGEGEEKTRAKFTIGMAECKLHKVYAHMAITEELWSDKASFKSSLDKFITDPSEGSLIWQIDRAIVLGSGTNTMYGIMSADSNGTIGVTEADPLDEVTLNAFNDALTPASQKTSEWYMSQENFLELQAINFTNEADKYYENGDLYIYGKKVNVLEQMYSPYDLMLGDVSQYGIALKEGSLVEQALTIHILFNSDDPSIRWGIRINGKSFGSKYTLDSGDTVGTFVIPASAPAEESSSSSSIDSSSSEQYSNSSSSSTENYESRSSNDITSVTSSSSSSSSSEGKSSSSSSSSTSSSEGKSLSSNSSSSSSSSSSSEEYSSSSSNSSGAVGPCNEYYTASGFATSALNGRYDFSTRYNSRAAYKKGSYYLWYSSSDLFVISTVIGSIPSTWLATADDNDRACPNGTYNGSVGTIV